MNLHYLQRYQTLITKIRSLGIRKLEYQETHHIQPRCLGGSDHPDNLIALSLREHFLAHWLLWKAYPENLKVASAFLQMVHKNPKKISGYHCRLSSRTYENLKSDFYRRQGALMRDRVFVKDATGTVIEMTRAQYQSQNSYKFHTTGKIYAYDRDQNQWVYITTATYHQNKNKYQSRLDTIVRPPWAPNNYNHAESKFPYLDVETGENMKITKLAARIKNHEYGYRRLVNVQNKVVPCWTKNGELINIPLKDYRPGLDHHRLKGMVVVYDQLQQVHRSIALEEYFKLPDRYNTSTKNKVLAKDSTGKTCLVTSDEFKQGQYVGQTRGQVVVKNKNTNQYQLLDRDEFLKAKDQYQGAAAGKVNVIDMITGLRSQIPKLEFDPTRHQPLGNKNQYFRCQHRLTKRQKNISIYEWRLLRNDYEILDFDAFDRCVKHLTRKI